MKQTKLHKTMYLHANNGITKSIDILNGSLSNEEKIALCLRLLIGTAQNCEDIYVEDATN